MLVKNWPRGNGKRRLISVGEFVRVHYLGPDGRSLYVTPTTRSVQIEPEAAERIGLPLLVPVDAEQLLTKRDIAELCGVAAQRRELSPVLAVLRVQRPNPGGSVAGGGKT